MNDDFWLRVYHALPAWAWDVGASARGWQLARWRYGAETAGLVQEARARESWDPPRWKLWQQERLARLLDRAARRVPYYRAMWAARRAHGDGRNWEDLANWPVLGKEEIRRHPEAFLAEDCDPRRLCVSHTSGTTGTPLQLWESRETVRRWYALFEARWLGWHGVSHRDRWAIFGGQLVVPVGRPRPPFWVRNWPMKQLYLSCYHLAAEFIPYYVEALRRFRPVYVWGYPSALAALAEGCRRLGVKDLRWRVILTNAEPLYARQRDLMEEVFQTPVRETYGMCEMAAAAGECEEGRLHLWPDAGVFEVVDPDAKGVGDVVVTGLLNEDMPLVRYRVGDRARLDGAAGPCACGRGLPLLDRIEGRTDDVLVTPDGRKVGRLDPVFKADLAIREAQIVQVEPDLVKVRVVAAEGFTPRREEELVSRLRLRLGEAVRVHVERVQSIERSANGKFRAVVNRLGQGKP